MINEQNAHSTAGLTRRGFLGAAAAATVGVGVHRPDRPTSPLLDPKLQALVGNQERGIVIDAKTSTLKRFVLLARQYVLRECEVSVQIVNDDYEVTVLGESAVLASTLPRLGFGLQASGLIGLDLDRYGCLAVSPEQVFQICTRLFEELPSEPRNMVPSPAIVDWPIIGLLEQVVERFPDLDVSGSGPFGRLEIGLPDGGLSVSRDNAGDQMNLHVWIEDWRGLLLPHFEGFRGLRRYVDSLLENLRVASVVAIAEPQGFLDEPGVLFGLIEGLRAVESLTISVI